MTENSQYVVSARKYRPATFVDVVGQRTLTATLKNAISSGRPAQAYLFCGPRGVGKTSCARIFARTINCMNPTPDGEACGECDSCIAISKGNSFNLIELDAASNNSVDDIRNLIEQVNVPPQQGKYKVFIIDEVHMLTQQAFNAFLKTLEEPPKYAIFILATTEKHKVIPTILSRCQIYDFKRITIDDMVEHLKYVANDRGVSADPKALGVIARKADGAMRDALSIFDQVAASSPDGITYDSTLENLNVLDYDYYFRLIDAFAKGDISEALLIYKEVRDKGFDSLFFINGLANHVRDLMVSADPRTLPLLELDNDTAASFRQQTSKLPLQWYYAAMKILNDADYKYRTASNKQLLIEVSLIRLCQLLKPATPPFDLTEDLPSLRDPMQTSFQSAQSGAPAPATQDSTPAPQTVQPATSAPTAQDSAQAPQAPPKTDTATPSRKAPTAAPTGANKPKPASSRRPKSFRLTDQYEEASLGSIQERNESFTDQDFDRAWNNFMAQNSDMHILLSAMRVAKRERKSDTLYYLEVEHPAQAQAFESSMTKLAMFMRDQLHNDHISFETSISEKVEFIKPLTPHEFLKKVISENASIGSFLQDIDAELSI